MASTQKCINEHNTHAMQPSSTDDTTAAGHETRVEERHIVPCRMRIMQPRLLKAPGKILAQLTDRQVTKHVATCYKINQFLSSSIAPFN